MAADGSLGAHADTAGTVAREKGAESSGEIKGGGSWAVYAVNEDGKVGHVLVVHADRGVRVKRRLPKELATPEARARRATLAAPEIKRQAIQHAAMDRAGSNAKKPDPSKMTFRDVGELWTKGDLAKRFPDHVKEKRSSDLDSSRLGVLYREIGDVPIDDPAWVDHAERAMTKLPATCKTASARRQYAQLIQRVLGLAAYPLRLIPAVPLPRGFLPKSGGKKADQWLRPAEDRKLLAFTELPLLNRLLWGFLAREGMRVTEALGLRWRDVDLEIGSVTCSENKTNDARTWALDPGVVRALKAYRERLGKPDASSRIFVDEKGVSLDGASHADAFREDLKAANVNRAELFEKTKNRIPIRAHDLRATFITINLANGKTEAWIADRTGHTSSMMINRYRRSARTAAELGLGALDPLDQAIPELAPKASPDDEDRGERNSPSEERSAPVPPPSDVSATSSEGARGSTSTANDRDDAEDRAPSTLDSGLLDPLIMVRIHASEPCQACFSEVGVVH